MTEVTFNGGVVQVDVGETYPDVSGQAGKYLSNDGTTVTWETVDALPDQTGQAGKVLSTDGTTASWEQPTGGGDTQPQWVWTPPSTIDYDWFCYFTAEDEYGNVYAATDRYSGGYPGNSGPLMSFDRNGAFRWGVDFGRLDISGEDAWMNSIAARGGVVVADVRDSANSSYALFAYDYDGNPLWSFGIGGAASNATQGIAVGPSGETAVTLWDYTTASGDLFIINPNGVVIRRWEITSTSGTLQRLYADYSPSGDLHLFINVSTGSFFYRVTYPDIGAATMTLLASITGGAAMHPWAVWSLDGSFGIGINSNVVQRFLPDGTPTTKVDTYNAPSGIRRPGEPYWDATGTTAEVRVTPFSPNGSAFYQILMVPYTDNTFSVTESPDVRSIAMGEGHVVVCGEVDEGTISSAFVARLSTERKATGVLQSDGTGRTSWWVLDYGTVMPDARVTEAVPAPIASPIVFTAGAVSLPATTCTVYPLTGIPDAAPFTPYTGP